MNLCDKTLEKLRIIINGDDTDDYKSGPQLVNFFNKLGFNDSYCSGFPSRWAYTDDKLKRINGKPELDKCIKSIFAVNNYIDRIEYLDSLIFDFNKYLIFDKWEVIRENSEIKFKKLDKIIIGNEVKKSGLSEQEFLKLKFNTSIDNIELEYAITDILKKRIVEVEKNISIKSSLSSIILIGSIMEGILLGVAQKYPEKFNKIKNPPFDSKVGKIKKFPDWTLNDFINAAYELNIIREDIKKFSHVVREFRNYIHPYQQLLCKFEPNEHTASICLQVLKALIEQIAEYIKMNK